MTACQGRKSRHIGIQCATAPSTCRKTTFGHLLAGFAIDDFGLTPQRAILGLAMRRIPWLRLV